MAIAYTVYDIFINERVGEALSLGAKDFYDMQEKPVEVMLTKMAGLLPIVCFTKGTLVYCKDDFIPIENIKVGDSVYSYSIEKDKVELSEVVNTLNRETQGTYEITAGKETIYVTAELPFYVIGKKWVKAKDLHKNDILKSLDGKALITSIKQLSSGKLYYYWFYFLSVQVGT